MPSDIDDSERRQDRRVATSMEDFYLGLSEIPEDLIVCPGERLHSRGFRWAPSSFLSKEMCRISSRSKPGLLTPRGLHVKKKAIRLNEDFYLDVDIASPRRYILESSAHEGSLSLDFDGYGEDKKTYLLHIMRRIIRAPALILMPD